MSKVEVVLVHIPRLVPAHVAHWLNTVALLARLLTLAHQIRDRHAHIARLRGLGLMLFLLLFGTGLLNMGRIVLLIHRVWCLGYGVKSVVGAGYLVVSYV